MELSDDFADWQDQRGQREIDRQKDAMGDEAYHNRQWVLSLEAHEYAMTPRCVMCQAPIDVEHTGLMWRPWIHLDAGTNYLHRCRRVSLL